jgi:HAD superfamily hydrolase (TIGR01509 family)
LWTCVFFVDHFPMTTIQAILFDLDGLMVDSEPHSIASWQAVLSARGASFDQDLIDRTFGLRVDETAQLLKETYHLPDTIAELGREKFEYQIAHLDGNVTLMPGLIELLDTIDRLSLPKAVASSSQRRYVDAVLQSLGLADRFSVIIGGDEVPHGKPAPDIFLAAARALRIDPAGCLVLEDAPAGLQAAKAGGMQCLAVPNPHTRSLDLSAADQILSSLFQVRDYLLQHLSGGAH